MRKYMLKIVYKNGDIKEYYCDYYTRKNGLLTYHIKSNRIDYTYSIPYGLIDEWTAFRVHSDKKQTPKNNESKIAIELDIKDAICVLEAIGSGSTLSNINDKEAACVVAIKALDALEKIKNIIQEEEHYEASNSINNPHPNQADYNAVHAEKFNRIWKIISNITEL